MTWRIDYSRDADKFALEHNIIPETNALINKFLLKARGKKINLDVKKLEGEWRGYFRIRRGRLRIIFAVDKDSSIIYIEKIDTRDSAYKRK
jgi:mRNA interferase RelE/StbE